MKRFLYKYGCALWVALLCAAGSRAATTVGTWTSLYKGIDHSVGTNTPGTGMPSLTVVHALRVDLLDPDVQLRATPRVTQNYINGSRETVGLSVSEFLTTYGLQAAVNANFFSPGNYYPPAGTVFTVSGLQADQGEIVSTISSPAEAASFVFDQNKVFTFIPVNWPPKPNTGVFTAITGDTVLLRDGTNMVASQNFDVQPRTVFGVSGDRRYLFLVALDGRQPGYSDGATLNECARWLLLLGARDGINVDGGGSTTLVVADTTGAPLRLNSSSAVVGDPFGRERIVGSHFGVYAKPIPGFINDVAAVPDDTTAVITWTTLEPATGGVRYGLSPEFELTPVADDQLTNVHTLTLSSLIPATTYYFQVFADVGEQHYSSSNFVFTTTNYVTTNQIFDVGQQWKYSSGPFDGVSWFATDYDDSTWQGPGAGVLWADTRATPNPNIPDKATQLLPDETTGFPYVTYYFRGTFVLSNLVANSSLEFSGRIDDGAAFYVNGVKSYLLRLADDATSATIAIGYPCSGDADCLDYITIPPASNTNLVVGTNIVAVEVHNYNARSPDITFGLALSRIEPMSRDINLQVSSADGKVRLEWSSGAVLQSAPNVDGPWDDVDPAPVSPALLEPSGSNQFFRLRR